MKTIKEVKENSPVKQSYENDIYLAGYKDAIEGIFNDVVNMNIENEDLTILEIEKYLQNLMK